MKNCTKNLKTNFNPLKKLKIYLYTNNELKCQFSDIFTFLKWSKLSQFCILINLTNRIFLDLLITSYMGVAVEAVADVDKSYQEH